MKHLLTLTLILLVPALLTGLLLSSCATTPQPAPGSQPLAQIPAGPGKWVKVKEEIPLDTLVGKRVVLPYGAQGLAPGADAAQIVTYSIAFTADPFAANDRCAMTVVALIQTNGDGTTKEVPATGTVLDNSDSQSGFRIEFSKTNPQQLVIPANATASVIFAKPVELIPGMEMSGAL